MHVSLEAMKVLFKEDKHNLVYHTCLCFIREHENEPTRMPLNRMPFGLIDYNLRFFSAASLWEIGMEDHYAQWLETMFAHFGQKWLCLFRGPFWQYDVEGSSNSGASLPPVYDQNACRNDVPSDSNITYISNTTIRNRW